MSTEIYHNEKGLIGCTVLVEDAVGAVWDIGGRYFTFDMRSPEKWPEPLEGLYFLKDDARNRYAFKAKSFDEACAKFRAYYSYRNNIDSIVLVLDSVRPVLTHNKFGSHDILIS